MSLLDNSSAAESTDPFASWVESLVNSPAPTVLLTETGSVTEVADGVAIVSGLARALADEFFEIITSYGIAF